MAHLDLEEQEQLDELKHFWNKYGNLISWVLIAVFGTFAAWNGWQYWERSQSVQASALYDELERAAQSGDVGRVEQAYADIKDKFGRTAYAQQAALVAARTLSEKGKADAAKAALSWVAESASDDGYRAVARLRLAGMLADGKAHDEALRQLSGEFPKEFQALASDRRGDILLLQGKRDEARAEFTKAWQGLNDRTDYRNLIEVKLTSLGVDVAALKSKAAPAAAVEKS